MGKGPSKSGKPPPPSGDTWKKLFLTSNIWYNYWRNENFQDWREDPNTNATVANATANWPILDTNICVHGKGKSPCYGDSGGKMMSYSECWFMSQRFTKLFEPCDQQLGAVWHRILGSSWVCTPRSTVHIFRQTQELALLTYILITQCII